MTELPWPDKILLRGVLTLVLACGVSACGQTDSPVESLSAFAAPPPPETQVLETTPFDVGIEYSRELHVSPGGDDAAGDGSGAAPYRTLAHALKAATPGTRIRLAPGIHVSPGVVRGVEGRLDAPIAVSGPEDAIIDAAGGPGVFLPDSRFVVLEGFSIRNAVPHGVNIDDGGHFATPAEHIVLRRLQISAIGTGDNHDCMKLSGVKRFHVVDSDFSGCDQGEAIDMVGCHEGEIAGNRFHDTPATAVQTKGGSADILIHSNRFERVGARAVNLGGHTGEPYFRPLNAAFEAERIRVAANLFLDTGEIAVAFTGCNACVVAQNTIVQSQGYVARLAEEHPERGVGRDGVFANNLVVYRGDAVKGMVGVGPEAIPERFTLTHNLWYDLSGRNRGIPKQDLYPGEAARVGEDPLFRNPEAGDYRPQADSPARAAGTAALPVAVARDYDGRNYAEPPSLGAFAGP